MSDSAQFLNPSEAARRLGVSAKALRLYEQHGLVLPVRTTAGWRTYGPVEMARAGEIAALRTLGLSLAQVARVLSGDPKSLEPALSAHQTRLEGQFRQLAGTIEKVRTLRGDLARGDLPAAGDLVRLLRPVPQVRITFSLPWPWGGELFELGNIRAINFIIGPLGSGKTRLARAIAENLVGAVFLGLDRLTNEGSDAKARTDRDAALAARTEQTMAWLVEDGAVASSALMALVVALEAEDHTVLVIDMIEQALDHASQEAVIAYLRSRGPGARPLFLLTRSNAILDLTAVGPDETIIFCPANHSPPSKVAPYLGAPGYEAVATCLASPEVRARTEGVIAWRPQAV